MTVPVRQTAGCETGRAAPSPFCQELVESLHTLCSRLMPFPSPMSLLGGSWALSLASKVIEPLDAAPAPMMAHLDILFLHSRTPGSTSNSQPAFFQARPLTKTLYSPAKRPVRPFVENATRPRIKKKASLPHRTPDYHLAIRGFVSELIHFDK